MEDNSELLHRLHEVENSIGEIKARLDPSTKGFQLKRKVRFLVSNWGFFAFWITAVAAVGGYWYYGLSYFEAQKNISKAKHSAEPYRQLGDRLMLLGEREAAEDAYNTALRLNPSNEEAMRGLLKTEVFEPLKGQKVIIPEVVDRKIEYLGSLVTDKKESYVIWFFKGQRYEDQDRYDLAKDSYAESIKRNPEFVYGYVALAYVSILNGDGIDFGMNELKQAQQLAPDSPLVLNNLGFCYMEKGDYPEAFRLFERSRQISPYLEVWINLGEVQRYKGDEDSLAEALSAHERALELLADDDAENESAIGGDLAINYMPKTFGDDLTPKQYEVFSSTDDKRILVLYELSFDYALRHEWAKANETFERAFQLNDDQSYAAFIDNKIMSIENLSKIKPDQSTKRWLEKQKGRLAPSI